MKTHLAILASLAAGTLAGCACLPWSYTARATEAARAASPQIQPVLQPRVMAEVMMRVRIALPEDAVLMAEVTDPATGAVIAESSKELQGMQLPQTIELELPGGTSPGTAFDFRAAVRTDGKVSYLSDSRRFDSGSGLVALGMVEVVAYSPLAFSTEYTCSGVVAEIGVLNDKMVLRTSGQDYIITEVATASGAKYAAQGEPETSFWSKDDSGTLVVEGATYSGCIKTGGFE
jgi:uncharacterized lipoprotein YbaY